MNRHATAGALVVALALALAPAGRALAQEGRADPEHQAKMEEHEAQMRAHMEQMEEARASLDALVATMNSATGEARIEATTAVVAELAAQHQRMHEHMASMMGHGMMRQGMMGGCMMRHGEGAEDHGQEHGEKHEADRG